MVSLLIFLAGDPGHHNSWLTYQLTVATWYNPSTCFNIWLKEEQFNNMFCRLPKHGLTCFEHGFYLTCHLVMFFFITCRLPCWVLDMGFLVWRHLAQMQTQLVGQSLHTQNKPPKPGASTWAAELRPTAPPKSSRFVGKVFMAKLLHAASQVCMKLVKKKYP